MIRYILITLGAIIGSFLLFKFILPTSIFNNWARANKFRVLLSLFFIFIILAIFLIYKVGANKGLSEKEVIKTLKNLDESDILSIKVFGNFNFNSNSLDTIYIKNDSLISEFSIKLKFLKLYRPYTPMAIWDVDIFIDLKNNSLKDITLDVIKNRDGKYCLWILRKTWFGEYNLGSYQCEELGLFLEMIRQHSENHLQTII